MVQLDGVPISKGGSRAREPRKGSQIAASAPPERVLAAAAAAGDAVALWERRVPPAWGWAGLHGGCLRGAASAWLQKVLPHPSPALEPRWASQSGNWAPQRVIALSFGGLGCQSSNLQAQSFPTSMSSPALTMGQIWFQILALHRLPEPAQSPDRAGKEADPQSILQRAPGSCQRAQTRAKAGDWGHIWGKVATNFPCGVSLQQPLNPSLGKSGLDSQGKWEVLRSRGPQVMPSPLPEGMLSHSTSAGQMLLSMSSNIWPARVFGV